MELYIDSGEQALDKAFFDALQGRADELTSLGGDLSWERLDNRRASRSAV